MISDLGKHEEDKNISTKKPYNPNLVRMPRYNLAAIKSEYELKNNIFKSRKSTKPKPKISLFKQKVVDTSPKKPYQEIINKIRFEVGTPVIKQKVNINRSPSKPTEFKNLLSKQNCLPSKFTLFTLSLGHPAHYILHILPFV